MVIALAILRAGATVVPIDALMEDDSFFHVLKDCHPKAVFTDQAHKLLIEGIDIGYKPEIFLLDSAESPPIGKTCVNPYRIPGQRRTPIRKPSSSIPPGQQDRQRGSLLRTPA